MVRCLLCNLVYQSFGAYRNPIELDKVTSQCLTATRERMGGEHCHNLTRARFSYSGRAISYSGRAVSYSGRAISYSGRAVSYLGGAMIAISYSGRAISLQLRNSTLGIIGVRTFCYSSVTDMIPLSRLLS